MHFPMTLFFSAWPRLCQERLTPLCGGYGCSLGHDGHLWLGPLLLRHGCGGQGLLLGLHDTDVVGQGLLGADLTTGIPGQHDLHLDTEHTWQKTTMSTQRGGHWRSYLLYILNKSITKLTCTQFSFLSVQTHLDCLGFSQDSSLQLISISVTYWTLN